ncbi:MAG: hypothetical protein LBG97_04000 [Coriobacteriales bacterium]|jgi:uroporphyrinogen-III decarboxylase|nr:hypothetical protein [Coriobacteriales bacterium]
MLTAKENYLIAARGGKPERVPVFPQDANFYVPSIWDANPETGRDWMGVAWLDDPSGKMPDVAHPIMKEAKQWREMVKFPDLSKIDWEGEISRFKANGYDPNKIDIAMVHSSGPFLLPINMLGWEEGLCALYEDPDEMDAFVSAITDFLVDLVGYIGKYYQPSIMFTGDDLAAGAGPLISRDLWVQIYKPKFERIVKAIHSFNALAEFHNCGNNQFFIEEFLDAGADICQLPMPNEALLADKQRFGSRLVITGGWDRQSAASKLGASEEVVRESARYAIDTYGKDGALIFWDGGIICTDDAAKQKLEWLLDEVAVYGAKVYSEQ